MRYHQPHVGSNDGERWRYRKPSKSIPEGWQETPESFLDPLTGKRLRVFYHPETGQRKYVESEAAESAVKESPGRKGDTEKG